MTATDLIGAIDQGTTSTRFMIIDHDGRVRGRHQLPHDQLLPRPGWVEHDAEQIWARTRAVIEHGLADAGCTAPDLAAVGVTNQRETTVLWHRGTGRPYGPAIVWQDLRTAELISRLTTDGHAEFIRERTGLPPATYFAAGKIAWLLDHVDGARRDAEAGDALAGTIDSWLLWNLTGGPDGGVHITDTTNASRTMLMDLRTGQWDPQLLVLFDIPRAVLPTIRPSTTATGFGAIGPQSPLAGVPITALLGDQHAALIGHRCFGPGAAKATFGTGTFVLLTTGTEPVRSTHGLLTTIGYHLDGAPPMYALEGSVAVAGSAVQWLRDQLGVITETADVERLAAEVADTGGVYFVPAFSGLFAPYWRSDARGTIVGLTRYSTKAHLARATLEAIGYATRDVIDAMQRDSDRDCDCDITLDELRVDGGISENELCMQLQADILGVPVSRPAIAETTALGAAYAAGLAIGFWSGPDELSSHARQQRRWQPQWDESRRRTGYADWRKAVQRSTGWVEAWVEAD